MNLDELSRPAVPKTTAPLAVASLKPCHLEPTSPAKAPVPDVLSEPIDALLAEEDTPVPWIVEGLVAEASNGFIAAEPKVGKSWLGLLMALCTSLGLPFLGFTVPKPRRVLYIQEEDSRRRVRHRLGQLMRGLGITKVSGSHFRAIIRKGLRIDEETTRTQLEATLQAFQPELVIVDVFNSIHTADETSQERISAILAHFTALTRAHRCGFLLLHHFRKAASKKARPRGGRRCAGHRHYTDGPKTRCTSRSCRRTALTWRSRARTRRIPPRSLWPSRTRSTTAYVFRSTKRVQPLLRTIAGKS